MPHRPGHFKPFTDFLNQGMQNTNQNIYDMSMPSYGYSQFNNPYGQNQPGFMTQGFNSPYQQIGIGGDDSVMGDSAAEFELEPGGQGLGPDFNPGGPFGDPDWEAPTPPEGFDSWSEWFAHQEWLETSEGQYQTALDELIASGFYPDPGVGDPMGEIDYSPSGDSFTGQFDFGGVGIGDDFDSGWLDMFWGDDIPTDYWEGFGSSDVEQFDTSIFDPPDLPDDYADAYQNYLNTLAQQEYDEATQDYLAEQEAAQEAEQEILEGSDLYDFDFGGAEQFGDFDIESDEGIDWSAWEDAVFGEEHSGQGEDEGDTHLYPWGPEGEETIYPNPPDFMGEQNYLDILAMMQDFDPSLWTPGESETTEDWGSFMNTPEAQELWEAATQAGTSEEMLSGFNELMSYLEQQGPQHQYGLLEHAGGGGTGGGLAKKLFYPTQETGMAAVGSGLQGGDMDLEALLKSLQGG